VRSHHCGFVFEGTKSSSTDGAKQLVQFPVW
jgi:hypothetical protein